MTALAANSQKIHKVMDTIAIPVEESTKIYAGALVCTNAAGYAVPANDSAGFVFQGWARSMADNSSGADGAINVIVERGGILEVVIAGANQAVVGCIAYATDDQTVTITKPAIPVPIGKIVSFISATRVLVAIDADYALPTISALKDVTITAAAENEILKLNAALQWVDAADAVT
jgi:hypothetical protein